MYNRKTQTRDKCSASQINVRGKVFDMRGNVISSTATGGNFTSEGNPLIMAVRAMKNRHKKKKKK